MKGANDIKRIQSLEGLRVIMLFGIIISHMEFFIDTLVGDAYQSFFHNATMPVDYFFILSGFGLMLSYSNNPYKLEKSLVKGLLYGIKKVRKIYPVYIFSILVFIPYVIVTNIGEDINRLMKVIVLKLILCLSLLQSAIPLTKASHSLNGVAWFLSSLFIIYIICYYIMPILHKFDLNGAQSFFWLMLTNIFIAILHAVLDVLSKNTIFDDLSYGFPLFRVFFVIDGMLLAILYKKMLLRNFKYSGFLETLIVLICFIWVINRNIACEIINLFFIRLIDVVLCVSLVMLISLENGIFSRLLCNNILIGLSKLSMYMYLLHYPIRHYIDLVLDRYLEHNSLENSIYKAILIIILTFIVSYLTRFIENFLKRKYLKL